MITRMSGHAGGSVLRRLVDIVVSAMAVVALWPVLAAAWVLVRVRLGRPAIFRQVRSGLHGQPFTIYKLRTMHDEAYAGQADSERTPAVGRLLRSYSVDELPQLINVLRGDMSLVGPRPTLPEQVERYTARQRRRLEVKPGITGYAQVVGRNLLPWSERIELDIWYIEHRSFRLDVEILRRTVSALVRPSGVVGEGGVNPDLEVTTL